MNSEILKNYKKKIKTELNWSYTFVTSFGAKINYVSNNLYF